MKYLASRLLRALLLLLGVSVLCFILTQMAPGSFFDEMRLNPQISPDLVAALRSHYGLDRPVLFRYAHWMSAAVRGDLGYSIAYNLPVASLLWTRAERTLLLTSIATLLTWVMGVPIGVYTAGRRGRIWDKVIGTGNSLLLAVPEIVIALALLAIAVRWHVAPVGGMKSLGFEELTPWEKFRDLTLHMFLPVSILVLGGVPIVERHIRAGVVEALEGPCIQFARGLGIGRARLLFRHVLPLAANPAISLFGLWLAGMLGGSLLVEVVTGWPGMGPLILDATLSRDLYVVVGTVLFSAVFLVVGNLIADLLLVAVDPRIRAGEPNAE
jgi:peptide/nickel transport system permease protein